MNDPSQLWSREELEGEVFEMLFTLTDFASFKDLFVWFRDAAHTLRKTFTIGKISPTLMID